MHRASATMTGRVPEGDEVSQVPRAGMGAEGHPASGYTPAYYRTGAPSGSSGARGYYQRPGNIEMVRFQQKMAFFIKFRFLFNMACGISV